MDDKQILEYIAEPHKMTEPEQINEVLSYLNGVITDLEEKEFEDRLKVDYKWNQIRKIVETNTEADRQIKFTNEYREHEQTKRSLSKLRRNRGTLKNRYDIIAGKI